MRFHAVIDKILQLLPLVLLEILQVFEAIQKDFLASTLHAACLGPLHILIQTQSISIDLLNLLNNLFLRYLLRRLLHNGRIFIIMLYLSKSLKDNPIERFLVVFSQIGSHGAILL